MKLASRRQFAAVRTVPAGIVAAGAGALSAAAAPPGIAMHRTMTSARVTSRRRMDDKSAIFANLVCPHIYSARKHRRSNAECEILPDSPKTVALTGQNLDPTICQMVVTVAIVACTWSGLTHSESRPNLH